MEKNEKEEPQDLEPTCLKITQLSPSVRFQDLEETFNSTEFWLNKG